MQFTGGFRIMKTKKLLQVVFVLILMLSNGCGSSPGNPSTGNIKGNVVLTGKASYQNILVYLSGESTMVYTDALGNYLLTGIPAGTYTLNAAMTGYASASQQITVVAGQTVKALPMVLSLLATSFSATAPFTTIEDQPFSITVSALLNGLPLSTYNGTLMLSASWGDITPTSITSFSNGTATFTAWLNREGPASISFFDKTAPQATSSVGINVLSIPWRINTPPAVSVSSSGWDNNKVALPSVITEGGQYYMLYSGTNGSTWNIGLANSADGKVWTKYPGNPVMSISPTTFYSVAISGTSILYDNGIFKAWFTGYDGSFTRIGYASSANGITWTVNSNCVVNTGTTGTWDYLGVAFPSVIKDNGIYKMWFSGYDGTTWRIGYANSSDGINWEKYEQNGVEEPVLDVSVSGADTDGVYGQSVVKDQNVYKMYYTGISTGGSLTINYATSTDGINWIKSYSNPKLTYSNGTQTPLFLLNNMFLYFSYFDGTHWQIALASYP